MSRPGTPYRTASPPVLATFPLRTSWGTVAVSSVVAALGLGLVGTILGAWVWLGSSPPRMLLVFLALGGVLAFVGVHEARRAILPEGSTLRVLADRVELPGRPARLLPLEAIVARCVVTQHRSLVIIGIIPIPVSRTLVSLEITSADRPAIALPSSLFASREACEEAAAAIQVAQAARRRGSTIDASGLEELLGKLHPPFDGQKGAQATASVDADAIFEEIFGHAPDLPRPTPGAGEGAPSPRRTCASCATANSSDSVFCKKCGKRVEAEA